MKRSLIISALILVGSLGIVCGCSQGNAQTNQSPIQSGVRSYKRLIVIAIDVSKSTEELRAAFLNTVIDLAGSLGPADHLRIVKFASGVHEVHDGDIGDLEEFELKVKKQVEETDPVGGTDYSSLAEELADICNKAPEAEVIPIVIGDGENDYRWDDERANRYAKAAKSLSDNKKVQVVRFWGLGDKPKEWSHYGGPQKELRTVFEALGSRLQLRTPDQDYLQ